MPFRDPDGLPDGFTDEEKQGYVDRGLARFDEDGVFHKDEMTDEETRDFYDSPDSDLPDGFL